jgi:hypothetical protein
MEYDGFIQKDRAIAPTGKPEASTSHPHSCSYCAMRMSEIGAFCVHHIF